jgi:hypothetical protein
MHIYIYIYIYINMHIYACIYMHMYICRVIRKTLGDFRHLWYSSRDGHAEAEHVNRGRDTPSFCPTLQVIDMSALGDATCVNPVMKFLLHTLQHPVVNSSDCLHDPSSQLCHIIYRVWQELDYSIDCCRVAKGGHTDHL